MPSPPLRAVWRCVDARVHLALSPAQLADPVSSATQMAFENLLMRYNHSLNGVVVAHIGPLNLLRAPTFIDASPFAHVAGRLRLLLFNPPVGSVMVGVINYVGPDHLALRVFRTFHAVLPLHAVRNMFHYDTNQPHQWTRSDHLAAPENDLTMGRQIRFVVTDTKATREGLFQILASLDHRLCYEPIPPESLGLLTPPEEVPGQFVSPHQTEYHEDSDSPNVDVLHVTKRSSIERARRHAQHDAEQLLLAGDSTFGNVLAPVDPNLLARKQIEHNPRHTEPLKARANGVADEEAQNLTENAPRHKVFTDDEDDESQDEDEHAVEPQEQSAAIEKEEPHNAQCTTEQRNGPHALEREQNQKAENDSNEEDTSNGSAIHALQTHKEELRLVTEKAVTVTKSQESERSGEKSKDKARKSKHDKKRKRSKDEKEKLSTPSSKRKKKRRHSDSLLQVQKAEPIVEPESARLGITEVKKKKSKDKEKRKDKEKDKTKRADKEKKKEKHRSKEKRKRHEYDLSESYRESQQSEAGKRSKRAASSPGGGTPEKKRKASDAKAKRKADDVERNSSQNHVLSTKYESALEAVNVAPLVSQESAETKSEPVRDGQVQFRTQVQKRLSRSVNDNGDVPVKTQMTDIERDSQAVDVQVEDVKPGAREDGKKRTRKDSKEAGSSKRSSQDKSEKKRKKRKREKSEGEGSERRKKKKSRHKHEAEEAKREAEEEAKLASPLKTSKMSALASAISRGLKGKWSM